LEAELGRQREENELLKRQLAEAQNADKERKKLQDKVDKLENKVSISTPSSSFGFLQIAFVFY
jgi:cell shape-determining protein MreC